MDHRQALIHAYEDLGRRVNQNLRIQNGDAARLRVQLDEVHAFTADAERVRDQFRSKDIMGISTLAPCLQARNLLEDQDYDTLQESLVDMAACINGAITASADDMAANPIPLAQLEERRRPGRPRINIDKNWLSYASQGLTLKDIGEQVHCSARTVRRRLLDYDLAEPAPPVIQEVVRPDGTHTKEWHPTGPTRFDFKEQPERLDELVEGVINRFSKYSIQFVRAALRTHGHRVARDDIQASLTRVRRLQPRFVNRPIERRVYSVPEVNSLWHHDGNHSQSLVLVRESAHTTSFRTYPMEIRHPRFYRWKVTLYNWNEMQHEQQGSHGLGCIPQSSGRTWAP